MIIGQPSAGSLSRGSLAIYKYVLLVQSSFVFAALIHRPGSPGFGRLWSLWHRVDLRLLLPESFVRAAVGSGAVLKLILTWQLALDKRTTLLRCLAQGPLRAMQLKAKGSDS